MTDLSRANKSLCIICNHLSIWHVEFENRICEHRSFSPNMVLSGKVRECPLFDERRLLQMGRPKQVVSAREQVRLAREGAKAPKPAGPVRPINKPWR